jgi:hypothetical protein
MIWVSKTNLSINNINLWERLSSREELCTIAAGKPLPHESANPLLESIKKGVDESKNESEEDSGAFGQSAKKRQ